MTPEQIEHLVDAEIARRHLDKALEPPAEDTSAWHGILRHPLFLTVFAFIVTTVIGGYYDGVLKDRAEARANADAAIAELEAFAQLVYERQIRTDLVRSAIFRGNQAEALARKAAYDRIFVQWNTDLHANLLSLRYHLGSDEETVFEASVVEVIIPAFQRSDTCLTVAYDVSFRAGFPSPPPSEQITLAANDIAADRKRCGAVEGTRWASELDSDKNRVRACMNKLVEKMIPLIRGGADYTALSDATRQNLSQELASACKEPSTPE